MHHLPSTIHLHLPTIGPLLIMICGATSLVAGLIAGILLAKILGLRRAEDHRHLALGLILEAGSKGIAYGVLNKYLQLGRTKAYWLMKNLEQGPAPLVVMVAEEDECIYYLNGKQPTPSPDHHDDHHG